MDSDNTFIGYVATWIPWLLYLGVSVWLTFLIVRPLRSIAQSLREIASELKAFKSDRTER